MFGGLTENTEKNRNIWCWCGVVFTEAAATEDHRTYVKEATYAGESS